MFFLNRVQIGECLSELRKKNGLSQFDVANLAGISERAYANIERGTVNMHIETLYKICIALNVKPNDLLIKKIPDSEITQEMILEEIKNCTEEERKIIYSLIIAYLREINKV